MSLLARCVGNNADLYDAICANHPMTWQRTQRIWYTQDQPPPYYSNLLLLDVSAAPELLEAIAALRSRHHRPFTFKDGYSVVDGAALGFSPLFSAHWIAQEKPYVPAPWLRVETPQQLDAWERAWNGTSPAQSRVFPASCLSSPNLAFFGEVHGETFSAGCVVNTSNGSVGLSNVFGGTYDAAADCAASLAAGKPIVGYERGTDLDRALAAGFKIVGPLNIWSVD